MAGILNQNYVFVTCGGFPQELQLGAKVKKKVNKKTFDMFHNNYAN